MKTYKTFFNRSKEKIVNSMALDEISNPKIDYGQSVTDKSKYRPNMPLLQQVNTGWKNESTLQFDFPDGKIDEEIGRQMAFIRSRGLTQSEFDAYLEVLSKMSDAQVKELKHDLSEELVKKLEAEKQKQAENNQKSNSNGTE